MAVGLLKINPTGGAWVQLPSQPCDVIWFESADYDLSMSELLEDTHFHVSRPDGIFRIDLGGALTNLDTFFIRSDSAVVLFWRN
jgi:hypothetical protein